MATFIVNTRADENDPVGSGGNLSLREAINEANNTPGDDIITFDSSLSGIISLTSGQLVITSNISIEGNGSNITVDAGGRSRVFNVDDGNPGINQTVGIDGLTISGGYLDGESGAGIFNNEILTITNSIIRDNYTYNSNGYGGGIYNAGTVNITNSTVTLNRGYYGGGIYNKGTANITNSTIVASYSPAFQGDNIYSSRSATTTVTSSIIAEGVNGNRDIFGPFISGGNNLVQAANDGTGFTNGVMGDLVGIDPLLGGLGDNGGPTDTVVLRPGSPAIDAGSNPNGLTTDQRGAGFARVVGGTPDIGAFEVQPVTPPVDPPQVILPAVISIGILIRAQRDNLSGGQGDDFLSGFNGKDILLGNDGNDTLRGDFGRDLLLGGNDNDLLFGGRGRDTLDGGQGDDTLEGGFGRDLFVLRAGDGQDTILDYSDGIDQFNLDGLSFSQLEIFQGDNATLLLVESTEEVLASLVGVDASVIDAGDFISI
ncbi:choice-of-anchor Q domain-containing protein [Moorena sp. SIO3H5]|uniref:choice-of-anchor Q domain-containing protein n=1 Tax=Moorena sp. SIO3H5 TaxID=2607834 RepID=UPI0013B9C7AE|nr:choice-of-anchor Q domain-containing protein [Moorena sp. SIO3H5]NEO69735.1 hypothetical protein [Moorena sp. SIO3H5]